MTLHHGDLHCQVPILRATMLESSVKTPKTILLLLIASKWITWIHQASQVDTLAIIQWMNNLIPVVINATCKPPEIHTCITYTSAPYYSQYSLQKQVKRRTGYYRVMSLHQNRQSLSVALEPTVITQLAIKDMELSLLDEATNQQWKVHELLVIAYFQQKNYLFHMRLD